MSEPFGTEAFNWIDGRLCKATDGATLEKRSPVTGKVLCTLPRSRVIDVERAVAGAKRAQPDWASVPGAKRGELLWEIASLMKARRESLAKVVATETGKSFKNALGEADGATQLATFFAGEGQRLYGRTMPTGVPHRSAATIRCPIGVAGLIVAANTPIANVAWKTFPALVCGNAAILKPPEDAPMTASLFAQCVHDAGLPAGLFQVVQGLGSEAGEPLVANPDVGVISFTGSTSVGRRIAVGVGERMGRVSLELGGKNAFVVCDDADMELAVKWAVLSAFSNAGQRCAAGSRIIVFDRVYDDFRTRFVAAAKAQRVGSEDDDDFGPVINERQLANILASVERAALSGASVLSGGERLSGLKHRDGYFIGATVIEGAGPRDDISLRELFGPVACLYRAHDFDEALSLANDSHYGLTAAIHTQSIHRAQCFVERVQTGVVMVNAGTFGSEPHMPFGGMRASGNGTREPGTEALDVYSSLKDVYVTIDPTRV